MKNINSLYLVLFLLVATFSQLSSAKAISDSDVAQYMALSGIDSALKGIPAQMSAMNQQMQMTTKDPEQAQKVMDLLLNAWQLEDVKLVVSEHVKDNFSVAEMQKLLTWLNSDLARRIKMAEARASAPSFNQDFMSYMATLQTTPPTTARVKVIRNFVEVTNLVEHSLKIIMSVARGTIEGLMVANPGQGVNEEQIQTQMTQMEVMMRPALEQQMIMVSYFIYDQLTEQEIEQYTQFYQQPLGKKELTVMYNGIGQALNYWSTTAFENIASEFIE
ncbi:hypothetical protein H4J38_06900 [Colwellia sp. BRX10-3]|uniref:hypothetical protein n=1 Tax=Colwellia sp. BRX10-3 TaxID=2759844 RepID=UPI0015F51C3F|nr:hypothetical protein [Colwellia sp. BRX10-3]MBA6390511.1 hypothetical protein [Colwellia sp. BRX10-3]